MNDEESRAGAAMGELLAGNRRFVRNESEHPNQDAHRRASIARSQKPFALIFGCSDSRVAAEIIFDRGLGDLFVVRTAGHVLDNGVLGSIEFGVEVLQIPLVLVLGHDGCGAVRATLDAHESGTMPGGYLRHIVELITPSVMAARRGGEPGIDDVVAEHAVHTAALLTERSAVIAERVRRNLCAVVAMTYTLAEGRVHLLPALDLDAAG